MDDNPIIKFDPEDISRGKQCALIGYIIPALPYLFMKPNSEFARLHANMAILIQIACVVLSFSVIVPLLGLVLWVISLMAVLDGRHEVPIITDLARKYPLFKDV